MALTDSLRILITANGAQAEREFSKVGAAARTNLGHAETSAQRFGRSLTSAGVAMAAFGGVALVGLYKAAQAAQEEDLAIARLNNTIANSENLAASSAEAFLDQAAALQDVTTFADDATIGVQALLGQFGLTEDQIIKLTPLVLDLASKMDISLTAATRAVGRATQGTSGGLSRMIGQFDVGNTSAEAFGGTVRALRDQVGGFAEAEGATFNGQIEIMKNNLGDIAESVGRGAVTAFNDMLGPVLALSDAFQGMSPATQSAVGRIATFGSAGLIAAGGVSFLAGQVLTATERFKAMAVAMRNVNLTAIAGKTPWVALGLAIAYAANKWDLIEETMEGAEGSLDGATLAGMSTSEMFEALADDAGFVAIQSDEAARMLSQLAAVDPGSLPEFIELLETSGYTAQEVAAIMAGPVLTSIIDFLGALAPGSDAIGDVGGAADEATPQLDRLAQAAEEASASAQRLDGRWAGLNNTLSQFDAVNNAEQAVMDLRTAFEEATEEEGINAEELLGLEDNLSRLIVAYRDMAEAQNTNRQGVKDGAAANRQLREQLAGLAAFIPAELRPQFDFLTRDILETDTAARRVPNRIDINTELRGTQVVVDGLNAIYDAAIRAASAVGQTGGSLAGGGSYSGGGGGGGGSYNGPPPGGVGGNRTEELGRSIARELQKGALPVVVVG